MHARFGFGAQADSLGLKCCAGLGLHFCVDALALELGDSLGFGARLGFFLAADALALCGARHACGGYLLDHGGDHSSASANSDS